MMTFTGHDPVTDKVELMTFLCNFYSVEECTWSERQLQLVSWAFSKWKFHKFTSLRVSFLHLHFATAAQ